MRIAQLLFLFVAITANAANVAPVVFSTTNYQVVLPNTAILAALVTDDGLPSGVLTQVWAKVSGPGTVTFSNAANAITEAAFSQAGTYTLSLTASDTSLSTTTNTVVTVYASPLKLHVMFSGTGSGTVNGASSNYTASYSGTTAVTLTATPSAGSSFVEWVGTGYTGTNNPCTVTVDSTKDISAIFDTYACATNLFYVDVAGNDSASGRLGSPWLTITNAVARATNGSRVIVGAGTWTNFISGVNNGSNAPIVFEGTRDTNGNWLTILDPSTLLNTNWVVAPEFATNAWKLTGLTHEPKELEIDHRRVAATPTNGWLTGSQIIYEYPNTTSIASVTNLFDLGSNDLVLVSGTSYQSQFWDSFGALYCTSGGSTPYTVYLKFADGSSPNGRNITVAPNTDGSWAVPGVGGNIASPAVDLSSVSNVTFRNFMVRGAFTGFKMVNLSLNCVVENNQLIGGWSKVCIYKQGSGGTNANGNIVRNNDIRSDFYGYKDCGAWNLQGTVPSNYREFLRRAAYEHCKYVMGSGNTYDESIIIVQGGNTNQIYGNWIHNGWGGDGIELFNSVTPASSGTFVWDNTIENQSSTGLLVNSGQTNLVVLGNTFLDSDINIRLATIGDSGAPSSVAYLFRNTSWQPNGIGQHFFFHSTSSAAATYFPTFWIYNNSFSGGQACFDWNGTFPANGGTPNMHILNNLVSGPVPLYYNTSSMGTSSSTNVGDFAYNLIPTIAQPAWYGVSNIQQSASQWVSIPTMNFVLTNGSQAINAALDTSTNFSLQSVSYSALPQDGTVKSGSAWDIGALEFIQPAAKANSIHVINAFFK